MSASKNSMSALAVVMAWFGNDLAEKQFLRDPKSIESVDDTSRDGLRMILQKCAVDIGERHRVDEMDVHNLTELALVAYFDRLLELIGSNPDLKPDGAAGRPQ